MSTYVTRLTHNETSTAVSQAPPSDPRVSGPCVVVDATSAAGGPPWVRDNVDVYYFVPQNASPAMAAFGLPRCSPATVERIRQIGHGDRWRPASLDLNLALDNSVANQTYNTPALGTLILLQEQLQWMLANGGLDWCVDVARASANHLYSWADATSYASPFVADKMQRSNVVGAVDPIDAVPAHDVDAALRANRIVDTEAPASWAATSYASACFLGGTRRRRPSDRVHRPRRGRDGGGARLSEEVLTTAFDMLTPLHRPILVLALRGLFDIAEVATDAIDTLTADRVAPVVASIDPDPFYDFTQERPLVEFDESDIRQILWPTNEFRIVRFPGKAHDLVLHEGVEPHLRYATFADSIITVAHGLG